MDFNVWLHFDDFKENTLVFCTIIFNKWVPPKIERKYTQKFIFSNIRFIFHAAVIAGFFNSIQRENCLYVPTKSVYLIGKYNCYLYSIS